MQGLGLGPLARMQHLGPQNGPFSNDIESNAPLIINGAFAVDQLLVLDFGQHIVTGGLINKEDLG